MTAAQNGSFLRKTGEGEAYWVVGTKATVKGPNVIEFENPAGWEVPLHVHDTEDEVHYYLEGRVTVRVGDETFEGIPGSLCFLPKGIPHALRFHSDGGAGRWLWMSPQDRADFVREIGVPASEPEPQPDQIDMARIAKVFEQHGVRFLDEG